MKRLNKEQIFSGPGNIDNSVFRTIREVSGPAELSEPVVKFYNGFWSYYEALKAVFGSS